MTTSTTTDRPEWRDGAPEPGPEVQAVKGRTHRMYQRETDRPGCRWVHRASGNWFVWPALLHYEVYVQLVELGGPAEVTR